MGGKKKYINIFGSFMEPFNCSFNGHFPGQRGYASTRMSPFWILLELRMTKVVVTTGAIRRAKIQSNHHHRQTNTQHFYNRLDALPVV